MRTLVLFLLTAGLLAALLAIVVRYGGDPEPSSEGVRSPPVLEHGTESAPAPAPIVLRLALERRPVRPWARFERLTDFEKNVDAQARARSLGLDAAEDAPVALMEIVCGDPITYRRRRSYRPEGAVYVAGDGDVLTRVQVDELRGRALASRPQPAQSVPEILAQPDAYLASLGITDDVLAARLATIRAVCVDAGWNDADGIAPEIPRELDELFTLDALKRHLVEYLLPAPGEYWAMSLELPGRPWIHLCSSSDAPDALPWYVAVEGERWYAVDPELSRAVLALAPPDGWMRARLEEHAGWRESFWSRPERWGDIRQRVNEVLAQKSYERLPGWAELGGRFQLEIGFDRPTGEPVLPEATLNVLRPGTIDAVFLRPDESDRWTWTDVVAAYARAEQAAERQPWLARWKQENSGRIGVFLPPRIDNLVRHAAHAAEAWEEAGLAGTPELPLSFSFPIERGYPGGGTGHVTCGRGVLSAAGDLLILQSNSAHGPLAREGLFNSELTRCYGVVRPGAAPEIRTRQQ